MAGMWLHGGVWLHAGRCGLMQLWDMEVVRCGVQLATVC